MKHALVDEVIQLMAKAGYEVIFPEGMERMCCGQIWESKGMHEALRACRVYHDLSEGSS